MIVKLQFKRGKWAEMMEAYRELLTYIKSAVTRNYSEKVINKILDLVSGSEQMALLQELYETTLTALQEAKNERLWFKTKLKLGKLWFDRAEYGRLQKIIKARPSPCALLFRPGRRPSLRRLRRRLHLLRRSTSARRLPPSLPCLPPAALSSPLLPSPPLSAPPSPSPPLPAPPSPSQPLPAPPSPSLRPLLQELNSSCQHEDGTDDMKKGVPPPGSGVRPWSGSHSTPLSAPLPQARSCSRCTRSRSRCADPAETLPQTLPRPSLAAA